MRALGRVSGVPVRVRPDTPFMSMDTKHTEEFSKYYAGSSGAGSELGYSAPYREFVSEFIEKNKIKTVLDLGCGDMVVMGNVDLKGASYHGVDCIPIRIERNKGEHPHLSFEFGDVRTYEIPDVDLILCKDVVQHWPTADVVAWLDRLKENSSKFRFALITNDCDAGGMRNDEDIPVAGHRRLDLTSWPFSIGKNVFRWETKVVVLIEGTKK